MADKSDKDRNASASAFGWAFQVGAGIKLMLENVKEFTALKMEGKDDDIEITLPNGKIYAQAKSVTQMNQQNTANDNLRKSLETLSDDVKKNSDFVQLIYITNILNPLSNSREMSPFYSSYNSQYDYSSLPLEDQNKLKDIVGNDFPVEKFHIHVLKFFGEGDNKFATIKENIKSFLLEALGDTAYVEQLWSRWYTLFSLNCADKPKEGMSFAKEKKEIMYPVIVLAIDNPVKIEEFQKVSDFEDYDEIASQYIKLINARCCEYDFVTPALAEYSIQRRSLNSEERAKFKYRFVINNWEKYENAFNEIIDDDVRQAVVKLTLLTMINRNKKIEQVRKAANLQ